MRDVKNTEVVQDESSEDLSVNPTNTPTFQDVVNTQLSRRSIIQGTLAVAATGFFAPKPGFAAEATAEEAGDLIGFTPLATEDAAAIGGQTVAIAPEYEYDVLIPWGTPIQGSRSGIAPYEGDPNTRPTAEEQEQMVGIGHDGMWFFPINLPRVLQMEMNKGEKLSAERRARLLSNRVGVLCVNHEFGRNTHVLGKGFPETLEDVRLSQAAHGVSVVLLRYTRPRGSLPAGLSSSGLPATGPENSTGVLTTVVQATRLGAPTSPAKRTSTVTSAQIPPKSAVLTSCRMRRTDATASALAALVTAGMSSTSVSI